MDDRFVGQSHDFVYERVHDFIEGTAPEVRTADAAREESVAGKQLWRGQLNVASSSGQEQARTAWRVTGRVHHLSLQISPIQHVAITQHLVNFGNRRRGHTEKCGLFFHAVIERQIGAVHHDRCAGVHVEFLQAADVINVRVRADDGFHFKLVAADEVHNAADFIARVEHDRFARYGVADNRAIALQHADWQ